MTAAVAIRRASDDDVSALTDMARRSFVEAFGESMSAFDLAAHLDKHVTEAAFGKSLGRNTIVLATEDDEIVGFVEFGPRGAGHEIFRLYVAPSHRGRGIGSVLMQAALADAQMAAAPFVTIAVWEKNEGAIRLYRRFGFEITGEREFVMASGAPADRDHVMTRRRSPG